MKITEARAEAKRRWGVLGFAKIARSGYPDKYVGYRGDYADVVKGRSSALQGRVATWEEAFANADARDARIKNPSIKTEEN